MHVDDRAEESPRARLSIHMKHSQYLQESNATNGRRCEYLTVATDGYHESRGHNHHDILIPKNFIDKDFYLFYSLS